MLWKLMQSLCMQTADPPLIVRLVPVETYKFRGGGILTVMGRNFGVDARVDVGPCATDP